MDKNTHEYWAMKDIEKNKLVSNKFGRTLWIRKPNPNDGRSVLIYLTEMGKINRDLSRVAVLKFNQAIKDEIGNKSLENFYDTIEKINNLISKKKIFNF